MPLNIDFVREQLPDRNLRYFERIDTTMREAVGFPAGTGAQLSGGVTLKNVRAYARTGADFVSSGSITHSAAAVDVSFRLELKKIKGRR